MTVMSTDAVMVTFIDEASGRQTTVVGRAGASLLEMALEHGVPLEHTCGGVCACATCHVHIQDGAKFLPDANEDELDQVEQAPGYAPDSRLACQVCPPAAGHIRCVIPKWNRNAVKEKTG